MKNFLKKLKNNWLDYLVIFISVFAICFVYLFTAFYQPKESDKNINKENIVKVLQDKKNARGPLGGTDFGSIVIGESLSDVNESQIKYFVNFLNIQLYDYRNTNNQKIEFELEFETQSYLQLYKTYTQSVQATPINTTFSISFDIPFSDYYIGNKVNEISIGTSDFECEIYDIYLDDIESFTVNIFYQIAFDIYVDTQEGDVLYENYYNYTIETEAPVSVYDQTASQYVQYLSSLIDESTTRYTPNKLRYFNLYDVGYDSGYQDGYNTGYDEGTTETEDYYEEIIIPEIKEEYEEIGYNNGYDYGLEIGYNNGYNDGVIAGSNNFNILNLIRSLFDLVWSFLSVEMLPNIKLIYIVAIPLVLSVLKFILGWFR